MASAKVLVASLIGGAIGAAIWGAIAYATNYEIGWIAWGVGALVGFLALLAAGKDASPSTGALAAVVAALSVAGGKYVGTYMVFADVGSMTDENYISYIADDVAIQWDEAGRSYEWPAGVDPSEAWAQADYPPEIWAEAEGAYWSMASNEREAYQASFVVANPAALANEFFTASFSLWDFLWFGLAIMSAFQIASGSVGNEMDEPAIAADTGRVL